MASDINKEENMDMFWSFLNGDSTNSGKDEKNKSKNEARIDNTYDTNAEYNNENNKLKQNDQKPEVLTRNERNREPQTNTVNSHLSKALKAIEDIEAFGNSDDLSDNFNLSSLSDNENDEDSTEKKRKEQSDEWSNKEKDEASNQQFEDQQNDEFSPNTEEAENYSVKDTVGKNLGFNLSTVIFGGFIAAIALSFRLMYIALGTVKDLLEYIVVCST